VVAGSNPVIPTKKIQRESVGFFVCATRQACLGVWSKQKRQHSRQVVLDLLEQHPPSGSREGSERNPVRDESLNLH